MADAFNPYREWLGLGDIAKPNHYQLLSLPLYEADIEAVVLAADRAATRVRSFRPGANAAAWSHLLDEIHTAKECLLNDDDKVDYDRRLRAGDPSLHAAPNSIAPTESKPRPANFAEDRYPPGMGPASRESPKALPESAPAPHAPTTSSASSAPAGLTNPAPASPTTYGAWPAGAAPNALSYGAAPGQPGQGVPLAGSPYGGQMGGYPGPIPMAGGVPMAYPAYGHPGAYPAAGYPAGYPGAYPGMAPLAQPMNPYYQPGSYPGAYPGAPSSGPPPAPPPAMGREAVALAGAPAQPMSYDPMAPVAVPGMAPAGPPSPRVVGFAAASDHLAGGANPQIPMGTAVPASGAIPTGTAVMPVGPIAAPADKSAGQNDPISQVRTTTASGAIVAAARQEQRSQRMLLLLGAGGGVTLLLAAVTYVVVSNSAEPPQQIAHRTGQSASTASAPPQPTPRAGSGERSIPRPAKSGDSDRPPRPAVETAPVPAPLPTPAPVPMPEPMPPAPMPTPEPAPTPTPIPTPTPAPAPTPKPEPAPEPTPTSTRQDAIALGKALTTAKVALGEQNFEEADKQLALAEPLAKLPEHIAKYQRLKEVANYVKQFRQAVEESVAALEAGSSFKVGSSTQVVVVETFKDKIIIRSAGQNRTYPFQDLPPGLAVAIADMKLDPSAPENRVVKGAYLAVDKRAGSQSQEKAKALWEEAQLSGVDTSRLLPFLTDSYEGLEKDISAADKKQDSEKQDAAKPATPRLESSEPTKM